MFLCLLALFSSVTGATAEQDASVDAKILELVSAGVRYNFEGRFDRADHAWASICRLAPDHPSAAVYAVDTGYWRRMNGDSGEEGAKIRALAEEGVELSRRRLVEDDADAEAHFYMGVSLMQLARLEADLRHYIKAGTYGEQGRVHLEWALELHPDWVDLKYQLGLFYYYASLLPNVMKWLNWLWFVPKGDGPTGIRYLGDVIQEGEVHRYDARFILGSIKAWQEPHELEQGLELYYGLLRQFPNNAVIHHEIIDMGSSLRAMTRSFGSRGGLRRAMAGRCSVRWRGSGAPGPSSTRGVGRWRGRRWSCLVPRGRRNRVGAGHGCCSRAVRSSTCAASVQRPGSTTGG